MIQPAPQRPSYVEAWNERWWGELAHAVDGTHVSRLERYAREQRLRERLARAFATSGGVHLPRAIVEQRVARTLDCWDDAAREVLRCYAPGVGNGSPLGVIPVAAGVGPTDPLTIFAAGTPNFYYVPDLGVTEAGGAGTGISLIDDQSSANQDGTQATLASRPTWTQTDAALGNRASWTSEITPKWLVSAWNPVAPGVTPSFIWGVLINVTHISAVFIWAGNGSSILSFGTLATAGQCRLNNGTVGPTLSGMNAGTAFRVEALYANTTADRLQVGATNVTGTAVGNTDSGGFALGARTTGVNPGNTKFGVMASWQSEPDLATLQALDAWVTSYYGGAVTVGGH